MLIVRRDTDTDIFNNDTSTISSLVKRYKSVSETVYVSATLLCNCGVLLEPIGTVPADEINLRLSRPILTN